MNETESNKVDEFRQFKSQIRGSREYLIVAWISPNASTTAFWGCHGKTSSKG